MAYRKIVGSYRSSDEKHTLRYVVYEPADSPIRAVLQISHGMCEYIDRYEDFAGFLCRQGILVCGNDHLGHGEMAQRSNTLGYFGEKNGHNLLPADVRKLTLLIKRQYGDLPYFLLGHSMGSFIARRYLAKYGSQGLLDGAVIMGTSGSNPLSKTAIKLAEWTIRRRGSRYLSSFLRNQSTGMYSRRFKDGDSPNAWLSRDLGVVRKYDRDPLCTFQFSAAAYRDLFTLLDSVSGMKWAERVPKELPILITSGGDDPVGNFSKGVREVYENLKKAGVKEVSLQLYEKGRHEILNETNRTEVYEDILRFLESHLEEKGSGH